MIIGGKYDYKSDLQQKVSTRGTFRYIDTIINECLEEDSYQIRFYMECILKDISRILQRERSEQRTQALSDICDCTFKAAEDLKKSSEESEDCE